MSERAKKIRNAVLIGTICSVAYLGVYFARNVLSAISPQLTEDGAVDIELLATLSSIYFITYALGQLLNGFLGERIRSKIMVSAGLLLAGISCYLFSCFLSSEVAASVFYGSMGFFLSMIYCPLIKTAAENLEPIYAVRINTAYSLSSLLGSPLAGFAAAMLPWRSVLLCNTLALASLGVLCYAVFTVFEKKKVIKFHSSKKEPVSFKGITILFKRNIVKFTAIAMLTGIIRTSVVFWMPTYFSEYLGFSPEISASIFSGGTLLISFSALLAVFLYEIIGHRRNLTLFIAFVLSTVFFLLMYVIKNPYANAACMIIAVFSANIAASVLWSVYCPSLGDTGFVSTGTGFLDFTSYVAAALSSTLFANAVTEIGWSFLILIWVVLMVAGIAVSFPLNEKSERYTVRTGR